MGEDAIGGVCFHPPWVQCYACFDPRSSRTIFAECECSKTPRLSQLIRAERSSNGSQRSLRALEPMGIIFLCPTANSLYSAWGWRFRPSSTMLDVFVALPSFALSRSSLDSLFMAYVVSFECPWLRVRPAIQLLSNLQLCLLSRAVDDQGAPSQPTWDRPTRNSVSSCAGNFGRCDLPSSSVHLVPLCGRWSSASPFGETRCFPVEGASSSFPGAVRFFNRHTRSG